MSSAKKKQPAALQEGALTTSIGFHIARARVTTQALFLRHIGQPMNLRPVEFSLLMLLHANDALTPKLLARSLSLSGPLLTALLDRLQERGLIERVRSTVDRRSQQVMLTAAGRDFTADLARRAPDTESELADCLSTAERAMLIELLEKIARHQIGGDPPLPD